MHTRLSHCRFGEVDVMRRRNSTRFSASWRGGRLRITGPCLASDSQFLKALDALAPRLMSIRESMPESDMKMENIELDRLTIAVVRQSLRPRSVILSVGLPVTTLSVGCEIDLSRPSGRETYIRAVRMAAHKVAADLLLPRAKEIAAKLGCQPSSWKISRGSTVLGKCTRSGEISLSSMCVFLPEMLRDYIVCHELAHLTHMNHSAAFHNLLDSYLGGQEKRIVKELKNYRWPIPR